MISTEDRVAIHELLALHGHLMDDGAFHRLPELFTEEFEYDVTMLGGSILRSTEALTAAAVALGDANPLAHHVTNVVITDPTHDAAQVRSKGLAVMTDGSCGTVSYEDLVQRTSAGWRIARRRVVPRRRPLHPF